MGFFAVKTKTGPAPGRSVSVEVLHKAECNACPLNNQVGLRHPYMPATGSKRPLVYMLGEAPGKQEDELGRQFVGKAGQLLRRYIPEDWLDELRWNNCVRCRPPGNATPGYVELECCRPSIIRDIEAAKPRAIFGFGNVPLTWAIGQTGILKWNGRRFPIKVGKHACWFFPMMHPSYVMRRGNMRKHKWGESDEQFVFGHDMRRAWAAIDDLPEPVVHSSVDAHAGVSWVDGHGSDDLDKVMAFFDEALDDPLIGLDYETNALRPFNSNAKLLSAAIATKNSAFAWPFSHPGAGWHEKQTKHLSEGFERFLKRYKGKITAHQLAFELEWTAAFFGKDKVWGCRWEDSVSQAYILDERMKMGKPDCLSLEFLCLQYFGINVKALSNVNRDKLEDEQLDQVLPYNAIDAKYHRLLYKAQAVRLKDEGLLKTYREHMKRPGTMVLTQLQGLPVDSKAVETLYRRYNRRIEAVAAKFKQSKTLKKYEAKFGQPFRPSANADILKLCRQILFAFPDKADEAELKKIKHPLIKLILRWRKANKVLSTYILPVRKGSPLLVNDKIHPTIETTRTRTWRTSSGDPNIQNWPKRSDEQKEVRKQIRPKSGYKVVSFDYGQIQARNVAMESLDKALVQAFWDDYDIHSDWAWRIADKYPGWLKEGRKVVKGDPKLFKAYRNRAKNELVFPSFFGAGAKSIAISLGIPEPLCVALHEKFWEMFPDIAKWHVRIKKSYQRNAYVTGLSGFRRRAPISANQLINSPIQADEAVMVCDAMYRLSRNQEIQASMEIHDDLTFIWPAYDIDRLAEIVIREMLACPFKWAQVVPLVVEMAVGDDWYDLKEVGAFRSDKYTGSIRDTVDVGIVDSWADGTGWADRSYAKGNAFNVRRRKTKDYGDE